MPEFSNLKCGRQIPLQMHQIYFISGLGADWRMFQSLTLPPHLHRHHVQWIAPQHTDEPIQDYVRRLLPQIPDPNPILIGLSFGGVAAIELSKILKPHKIILISSLDNRHALPLHYRLMGKLQLHKRVPFKLLLGLHPLAPWFFGAHTPAEKKLLKEIILSIDETYLRWSLGQLLAWKQEKTPAGIIHLHGTADKVLPFRGGPGVIRVEGGEHMMVLHRAAEISAILSKILFETCHD